jgi:hypothetical protein
VNIVTTDPIDADAIVRMGVAVAGDDPPIGEFKLRSLFPKAQWESFDRGQRQQAGKLFKHIMSAREGARLNGPNTANHQRYELSEDH